MPAASMTFRAPPCTCSSPSRRPPRGGERCSTACGTVRSNGVRGPTGARTGPVKASRGSASIACEGCTASPKDILLVPLIGHTMGHAGIAVRGDRGWVLQAADAYFWHAEMDARPRCTPGLRFYQRLMEKDRRARLWNQDRLRALRAEHGGEVEILCGHDPIEFERVAKRPLGTPAPRALRGDPEPAREREGGIRLVSPGEDFP